MEGWRGKSHFANYTRIAPDGSHVRKRLICGAGLSPWLATNTLYNRENFRGKDSIARQKFRQAIELAHNLGLFSHTPGSTSFDQEEASVEMERARASCACGIAILNS